MRGVKMETLTFQEALEQLIKPPFKYWILPHGMVHGSFYTFNTLREAKIKVEELILERGGAYEIMNVWLSKDPYRKGYMSNKILSCERDLCWHRSFSECSLHTAFYFRETAIERWNPEMYKKIKVARVFDNSIKGFFIN